ncbi:MAG: glycoside hydrolase family 99-like domain-containing protein [Fimbriimonadaceae bacterium]|nr:glycoside hydrolase family 99-like domain-containing protein [Fimbriimonadaceae bacterium]
MLTTLTLLLLTAGEPGLLGYWPLNGAAADASGQGHDAAGTAAWETGRVGQALRDGAVLTVPDHADLRLAPGLVLDCWVYFAQRPTACEVLLLKDQEYQLRVNPPGEGGRFAFFVYLEGWEPRVTGPVPEPGKWHHVVARWTGSETMLEVDGKRSVAPRGGVALPTTNPLQLGRLAGRLDEVRLLNPTLVTERTLRALPAEPAVAQTKFGGKAGWDGWSGLLGARARATAGRLSADLPDGGAVVSGPLAVPLTGRRTVSLELGPGQGQALLSWVTDQGAGSAGVRLWPDGRTSHVTPAEHPTWNGTLRRLAISFPGQARTITMTALELAAEPRGTPFCYVRNLAPGRAVLRSGREEQLIAAVRSLGATAATPRATLRVPAGVELLDPATQNLPDLPAGSTTPLRWRLRAARPVTGTATVELAYGGAAPATKAALLKFDAPLAGPPATYVPAPKPVPSDFLTLMHYCPLWKEGTHYGWQRIEPWPERRPAIGYYDEGTPVVADWHIKYALEHAIQGFIYCWYRADKSPQIKHQLGHAIHDGLLKARYVDRFKFSIMWENGCAEGCSGRDDLLNNLLPYWMENYFKHPSYVKIDNKPLLYIWVPGNVSRDLGKPAEVRATFEAMRAACRRAGFDGLWIVGCVGSADRATLERMRDEGWDASSAYGLVGPTSKPPGYDIEGVQTSDATESVPRQEDLWRGKRAVGAIPDIIDVMQGWDPRPWHGPRTSSYLAGATPASFEVACRAALTMLRQTPGNGLDKRVVVFDNWCEFGEGHYLEPTVGWGFQYLDVIRRVFGKPAPPPDHIVPEDVGLPAPEQVYLARRELLGGWDERPRVVSGDQIALWTFDREDASLARDAGSAGFHGLKQDFVTGPGHRGAGFVCRGGSVTVAPHPLLQPTDGLTISLWCRAEQPGQQDRWMLNCVGDASTGYRLGLGDGRLTFQVPKTSWSHGLAAPAPLPLGQWVHVAATYDGQTMRLFQDGREVAHLERGGPLQPSTAALTIGNYGAGHPRAFFQGTLDEVQLRNRALTPAEIAAEATVAVAAP